MKKENIDILPPQQEEITEQDFVFVQADESLHDKKFQTKPTTFFKDAMKRFAKNRSSVVAAGILFVLIAMAIIVPIADTNSVDEPYGDAKYLPPKWFDNDMNGFFDGTRTIEKTILDPTTRDLPADSDYVKEAVIGDIKTWADYADSYSPLVGKYGSSGDVRLRNAGALDDSGIFYSFDSGLFAKATELTLEGEPITFAFDVDKANMSLVGEQQLVYYAGFFSEQSQTIYAVSEEISFSEEVASRVQVENVAEWLKGYEEFATEGTANGSLGVVIKGPRDLASSEATLLVSKMESSVPEANFDNATQLVRLLREGASEDQTFYLTESASVDVFHSAIFYGSFRYDCYKAVFMDQPNYVFTEAQVEDYIARGWMEYTWSGKYETDRPVAEGAFRLTEAGETYCPIRTAVYENGKRTSKGMVYRELKGVGSPYRLLYSQGRIKTCAVPKYIFGTDRNGKDFFKVLFSGLLMSLGLGVLASAINIVIGLVWGSISGYFGGTTDFVMERVAEILGGVPFIIIMTLLALFARDAGHETSFGTFLVALCLTGWLGVAHLTRSQFYRYKGREYVLASRTLGASDARLIFRHILPNSIGTIVTGAVLMIPSVIFTEANIAYLLPGTLALSNSFGVTLQSVQSDLSQYPYLIVSGSIVMALIMISFNLFGNGLRDAFNPSLKGAEE